MSIRLVLKRLLSLLFGWLSQEAVIENVTVENSSFSSKGDAGGIAAYSYGGKVMTTIIGNR